MAGKTTSAKSTWWKSEWDRPPPCGYLRAEHFTYNGTVTRSKAARRVCSWWLRYNPDRQIDLGLRDELAADLAANQPCRAGRSCESLPRRLGQTSSAMARHPQSEPIIFEAQCVATILHT